MATSTQSVVDPKRELLRHAVATVSYRGGKTLRDAPAEFADFRLGDTSRTPVQILAHIGDLYDWALSIALGNQTWNDATPLNWNDEVSRFYAALKAFDDYLASGQPLHGDAEALFQGPIADSLTHIGQLAMLRRIAGSKMMGENYYRADIVVGRVGAAQTAPKKEF